MIAAEIAVAVLLCGVMTLAAFLSALSMEAMRIRPHAGARAYEIFEERVLPKLRLDEREGARRYAMLKQAALVLLTLDFALLVGAGSLTTAALAETLLLAFAALAVFGHIVPAALIARTRGEWAVPLAGPARVLAWTIQPLVLLTGFANSVVELGGEEQVENGSGNGADDIEVFLDVGEEEGFIGQEDRKLIQSVVEFGDKTVREVMTPRPHLVAIDADASLDDLRQLLIEEEYSRIPVYEGTIDRPIGFVHARDTLDVEAEHRAERRVRELTRPIGLVPETKPIRDLMPELQSKNAQMAIVVDEYGQTAGLVTMEDMMEEIVGEIRDESEPSLDVVEHADGSFTASGNLDLDRLHDLAGFSPEDDIESTTVGGLICEQLGRVPDPGARVRLDGVELEVVSADERRVRSVRIRRVQPAEQPEDSSAREDEPRSVWP